MEFDRLDLAGAYVVALERHEDDRGSFARTWDSRQFGAQGLDSALAQVSVSHNRRRGTLRGLHYQAPPREEAKVVTCIAGAIWDVIVDLRAASPTRYRWHAEVLEGSTPRALYVPEGFAHGFLTLADDSVVLYEISEYYDPTLARGARWDDPAFAIEWPEEPTVISARDRAWPHISVAPSS